MLRYVMFQFTLISLYTPFNVLHSVLVRFRAKLARSVVAAVTGVIAIICNMVEMISD